MNIEDILLRTNELGGAIGLSSTYDRKFLRSIARRISDGNALTTKQGYAALKLLRSTESLATYLGLNETVLAEALLNPAWSRPLVPSVELRPEVRYLGDNILAFRASLGKEFEMKIRGIDAVFSHGMNLVAVNSYKRLDDAIAVIGYFGLSMDQATEHWLADAMERRNAEPRVAAHEDKIVFDIPNHDPLAQFVRHVLRADYL